MAQAKRKKKGTASDRLNRRASQYPSESRLLVSRNLAFGSAAACLVVIGDILHVGANDVTLEIAVVAGCVSMPLWIAVGTVYEFFVFLGKEGKLSISSGTPISHNCRPHAN